MVSSEKNVVAIVVTYMPQLPVIAQLLDALSLQVDAIVVVDNGSNLERIEDHSPFLAQATEVIHLHKNYGIAHAQNLGIQWARDRDAKYVLLMDQDSIPDSTMVKMLLEAMSTLNSEHQNVACVGPMYIDKRHNNLSPFVRLKKFKFHRIVVESPKQIIPAEFVIASGCLIPMKILDEIGIMRDDFFIDYVDIEWGIRARHYGYHSYGVCAATMSHCLGEEPIKFLGRIIPAHKPLRSYYRFRNSVYLMKQPWITLSWCVADFRRLVLQYIFFSMFSIDKFEHFKMMSIGIWHGLISRMGKLENH